MAGDKMTDLEKRANEYAIKVAEKNVMPKDGFAEHLIRQTYLDATKAETALLSQHILDLQKDKGNLTDRVRELEQQIEKMQDKLKSDLIARLKEKMSYSTSPSCTKGMELFIKSIEKWEIKEND